MPKTRKPLSKLKKRSNRSTLIRELRRNRMLHKTDLNNKLEIQILKENPNNDQQKINNVNLIDQQPTTSCQDTYSTSSSDEYFPPLDIEVDTNQHPSLDNIIKGRRIVNVAHMLTEYEKIATHKFICTMGRMRIVKETRNGLISSLHFYCDNCEKKAIVTTDRLDSGLTDAFVWGSLSIGIGHSQSEEIMGLLDVPIIAQNTFARKTSVVKKAWQDHLYRQMQAAGEEEKRIALEKNHITAEGIPYITVIGDGGWSKRTYGHGYNASSGVGIIIGSSTKKPLFLGVRNKMCSLCLYYKTKGQLPRDHECALNFKGPSTAMEHDIIVEGFSKSLEQHGLIYKYYIGDGDSNVYSKILEKVSYGRLVVKIECANHMTRCVSNKLYKLATNTAYNLSLRKLLLDSHEGISRLERLVKGIRMSIKNCAKEENTNKLREDLLNAPYHVFGRHSNCRYKTVCLFLKKVEFSKLQSFCQRKSSGEEDLISKIENSDFFLQIKKILDPMVQKVNRLAFNETTNHAERYMSLVAKCTGGKRVNYTKRMSYTARANAAGLSYTYGPSWHLNTWDTLYKRPPGYITSKVFEMRQKLNLKRKQMKKTATKRNRKIVGKGPDTNYGPEAEQEDMAEDDLKQACDRYLKKIEERADSSQKIEEIEEKTRGQHENPLWSELRKDCLTASNFGVVIKRRTSTSCHNLIKRLLYSTELRTPAVMYGRINEEVAIKKYESVYNVKIQKCGLFIDTHNPFLGASPDGLIGDNGLIEIKCLPSIGKNKIKDAATTKTCFEVKDGNILLKKNHNYYFQIQGQLNITGRDYCHFVIFTENDFHVEEITINKQFWKHKMLPKLKLFFLNCMLPEIVNGRIPRGLKVRDPIYITEAKKKIAVNGT